MVVKIEKQYFFDVFWHCCCDLRYYNGGKYIPLSQLFLGIFHFFDSIFSGIVWTNKLHYFHQGIFFSNNG